MIILLLFVTLASAASWNYTTCGTGDFSGGGFLGSGAGQTIRNGVFYYYNFTYMSIHTPDASPFNGTLYNSYGAVLYVFNGSSGCANAAGLVSDNRSTYRLDIRCNNLIYSCSYYMSINHTECFPDCSGLSCGPSQCGNSCGTCNGLCQAGQCLASPSFSKSQTPSRSQTPSQSKTLSQTPSQSRSPSTSGVPNIVLESSDGYSNPEKAGIVVGSMSVAGLAAAGIVYYLKRTIKNGNKETILY